MSQPSAGLNTSKRKFYKLLDNLSSSKVHIPADNKNASTTTLAEPPTKRFRLLSKDRPTTAPGQPARPLTAGARERPRSSIFAVNSSAKTRPSSVISEKDVTTEQQKKTPNYAPWSHELFLARLKTFADVKSWTPKPPAIGEVEWAKRGWTVVAKDTVECKGGCEKRLVVRIAETENKDPENGGVSKEDDDWWMGDLEREMVNRYRDLIVDSHAEDCLWKRAGCKDDIYRIKMADPAVWQTELRERYLSLLTVESALPTKLDLHTPDTESANVAFEVDTISRLVPSEVLERTPSTDITEIAGTTSNEALGKINEVALAMALTGWSGQSQNTVKLACCAKCFQRAGLWLYKSKPATDDSSKSAADAEELVFNPIEQHREHCPWKNPTTQCALGRLEGMAGWEVLVSLVKGYRRHDRSPSKKTLSRPASAYTETDGEEELYKSKEEQEKEDKDRKSRLQRLKRAFTVKKGNTLSKGKE